MSRVLGGTEAFAPACAPYWTTSSGDPTRSALRSFEAAAKLQKLDEKLGLTPCLILTVSENGYGKRTDVDAYRLQSRGGKGVINMKANSKVGKVVSIQLVDDTTEMMVISQFGKIIRIDTKSVRSTSGLKPSIRLTSLRVADEAAAPLPAKFAQNLDEIELRGGPKCRWLV